MKISGLIYDRQYDLGIEDTTQRDVSVLLNTDNGNTWQERDPSLLIWVMIISQDLHLMVKIF